MDIMMTTAEVKAGRKALRNRTYRSVQPGDIVDFGSGDVRYREVVGYGSPYDGITRTQATFDVRTQFGAAPLWVGRSDKFTIWRKR